MLFYQLSKQIVIQTNSSTSDILKDIQSELSPTQGIYLDPQSIKQIILELFSQSDKSMIF